VSVNAHETKSRHAVKRDGSLQVAAVGATAKGLFEPETAAAYNLTVDLDVDLVDTDSECVRAQVVYVLTAINSEV
jgi:hypothetical protein